MTEPRQASDTSPHKNPLHRTCTLAIPGPRLQKPSFLNPCNRPWDSRVLVPPVWSEEDLLQALPLLLKGPRPRTFAMATTMA